MNKNLLRVIAGSSKTVIPTKPDNHDPEAQRLIRNLEESGQGSERYAARQSLLQYIDRLNARIAELEDQQEWHDASEPPDDDWCVLVEVVGELGVHDITSGWYEAKQGRWNIEYAGGYDILRWRELPRGEK